MDDKKQEYLRIEKLIKDAAKQYVEETKLEMPSLDHSQITSADNTEIVILRNNEGKIVAHYQYLKDYKFFRLDVKNQV